MRIDKAAVPFIAGAIVPAAVLASARRYGWAAGFAALGGFFAYFFRDPERDVPQDPGLVVAPADGRVMIAGPSDGRWTPPGDWKQITIFLSPLDVHINRTPVSGRVTRIEYRPGSFLPAYKRDAGANELNEIWIDHDGATVVVRQIVGVLARRIVCRVTEGQDLARGERIGLMKFGSRMDVFLPPDAELLTQVGHTVVAGETVLARLTPEANA
ncbi:MAG TPA: phosphatidylserine decarboxylase [Vicinamibacterales bacterium]|jgi:phosphatidylserine decarboxylase|nr:phosphatidylserine decarboxylase [Vicinamibacterales bacterium]